MSLGSSIYYKASEIQQLGTQAMVPVAGESFGLAYGNINNTSLNLCLQMLVSHLKRRGDVKQPISRHMPSSAQMTCSRSSTVRQQPTWAADCAEPHRAPCRGLCLSSKTSDSRLHPDPMELSLSSDPTLAYSVSAKTALRHGTRRAAYHAMGPRCAAVGHSTTTPQISCRAVRM